MIVVLACLLGAANAGSIGYAAPGYASYSAGPAVAGYASPAAYTTYTAPALAATSENVYRSAGNLHSISTHSKSIATPFSSSNKQFTSVTNPGIYEQVSPVAYAAPIAQAATYGAPIGQAAAYGAPAYPAAAGYAAAPVQGAKLLGVAYSPAVAVSHVSYSSPIGINYAW